MKRMNEKKEIPANDEVIEFWNKIGSNAKLYKSNAKLIKKVE